jgi:hypothetical protein
LTNGSSAQAINHAQERVNQTREKLRRARQVLLSCVESRGHLQFSEAITCGAQDASIDPVTVQQALWALVAEKRLRLTDDYEISSVTG